MALKKKRTKQQSTTEHKSFAVTVPSLACYHHPPLILREIHQPIHLSLIDCLTHTTINAPECQVI